MPKTKPFPCPECMKPSRDKITAIRHYAFTHGKLLELTDVTKEQLLPNTPGRTPRTSNGGMKRARPSLPIDDSMNGDDDSDDLAMLLTPVVTIEEKIDESSNNGNDGSVKLSDHGNDQEAEITKKKEKRRKRET